MSDQPELKEDYQLAGCCSPSPQDDIVGYHSYDGPLKVHRADCANLAKSEQDRLVRLEWAEILKPAALTPEGDYERLEEQDFAILSHFIRYGIDYAAVVAKGVGIDKAEAFDRCRKLRELGLIIRVGAKMVQYRKGISVGKWIKHRNHTYYEITDKGRRYIEYWTSNRP